MLLFKEVNGLDRFLSVHQKVGREVGFVPTMGALHDGHLSLIRQSKQANDLTVCSIFVNPTQFNEASDLDKYPRTTSADIRLLLEVGCDVLFFPPVEEVYPEGTTNGPEVSFGPLAERMEGAFRPGHFNGVAQVVHRLLEIVHPNRLYMGQKDYQQFLIIREMLLQTGSAIELVMCPIQREPSGLAMSSRNARLSPEERSQAAGIFEVLEAAAKWKSAGFHPGEISERAMKHLGRLPGFAPEYVEVVDALSLEPIDRFSEEVAALICAAVWVGDVRLIDNLLLDPLPVS